MEYEINSCIIELTRKCNMTCSHCLRGKAQNLDIKKEHITKMLENVSYISTVTFSGGEPSLNIGAINHFIDECKRLNVSVNSFYIATNGKETTDEFILAIMNLYLLCEDNEVSQVHYSNDYYHIQEDYKPNIEKLEVFKFFSKKYEKDGEHKYMINEGNFKENFNYGRPVNIHQLELEDNRIDGDFYLNVNGDIICCCDLSYENQEFNIVGNVDSMHEIEFAK